MSVTIAKGHVVNFFYTLTKDDGSIVDSNSDREAMPYLHGASNIVPGLERQMVGHEVGDSFDAIVVPADGYGELSGESPQEVPRSVLPADAPIEVGVMFHAQGDDGTPMPVWVCKVEGDQVFLTRDHPLAGETLNFAIKIDAIRPASDEEKQHGHPHGPGGHNH